MQIILLRVGIDKGTGGTLGPLFPDGRFEYIPIPESRPSGATPTYNQLKARSGGSLAQFLPERLRTSPVHLDPDFEYCTYGDPTRNKRRQLLQLRTGDIILFYAGLQDWKSSEHAGLFLVGYLTVKEILSLPNGILSESETAGVKNAHLVRATPDRDLALVRGFKNRSRLLKKAIKIAEPSGEPNQTAMGLLGYNKNLMRAIGRWIPSHKMDPLESLVESAD